MVWAITEKIQRCIRCAEHTRSQQKEPLQPHELPGRPWQKVSNDLFEIDKNKKTIPSYRRLLQQDTVSQEHGKGLKQGMHRLHEICLCCSQRFR